MKYIKLFENFNQPLLNTIKSILLPITDTDVGLENWETHCWIEDDVVIVEIMTNLPIVRMYEDEYIYANPDIVNSIKHLNSFMREEGFESHMTVGDEVGDVIQTIRDENDFLEIEYYNNTYIQLKYTQQ